MSRAGLTTIVAVLLALGGLGLGCKAAEKVPAKQRCDQVRLASLAAELDAAQPDARVALVSDGLLAACGDELYPTVHDRLAEIAKPTRPDEAPRSLTEDAALRTAIERICPKHAQIGEIMSGDDKQSRAAQVAQLCGFSRYALLSDTELRELSGHALFVWATHDFLLESGTPPDVAKTISRALFRVHEESTAAVLVRGFDGQRLVAVPAAAPLRAGPVVYVSTSELVFNEQSLASLDAGRLPADVVNNHLIVPLFEKLDEETTKMRAVLGEQADERVLVLAVDGGVTFASVVDILYTASRLGYQHFDFMVVPVYPILRALYVDPPRYTDHGLPEEIPGEEPPPRPELPPSFKVFILDDAYRVSWDRGESVLLPKLDATRHDAEGWDRDGLAKLVRERTAADSRLLRGVVSAENHIAMEVVLVTYATLLGPDCKQHEDGAGCLLPELIIEAGAG